MIDADQLQRSKRIQRRTGRTFHVATRLLPERVRHPTYVLYAFFRVADEVVDDPGDASPEAQRAELERIREAALGRRGTDDSVLEAFSDVRERYDIPDADVNAFIAAMKADTEKSRYRTYEELEAYMDGSAAAVGRMMTTIMEPKDPDAALPHATALGEAFQLTNFLRDVREDVRDRNRIYLPETTLEAYGVTEFQIRNAEMDDRFAGVMQCELERAERLYEKGIAGVRHLPKDCQLAVLLAAVLYVDHHRLIRSRDYDTLTATPSLSLPRKLYLLVRTRILWARHTDPDPVFRCAAEGFDGDRTIDWCPLDISRPSF